MNKWIKSAVWSAGALAMALSGSARAADAVVCVNCATSIQAASILASLNRGFQGVNSAVQGAATSQSQAAQGSARVLAEAGAKSQAEMAKSKAVLDYRPIDPCSATAMTNGTTGGAGDAMRERRGGGAGRGGGGGGSAPVAGLSPAMQQAVKIGRGETPTPSPEAQAALSARGACETFVGGTTGPRARACEGAGFRVDNSSGFPNADVRAETLFDGPQAAGDRTVRRLTHEPGNSRERAAIEAFVRNVETPVDLAELDVGKLRTDRGRRYMALRDAYDASMSLATKPLRDQVAMMEANRFTLPIIEQLLQSDDRPFIENYLRSAYPNFRRDGISLNELINLEAVRRYNNPQWHVRMSAAPERQLLQEQVQLQAANLWMTAQLLERIQQLSVLQGSVAASVVRQEKMPSLVMAHRSANGL